VSDLLRLRPYQIEAIEAVERDWAAGIKRPALAMATGSGKTATASHIIARRDVQTLFLVHRDELASQAAKAFKDHGLDVGVVKAERNDIDSRVIVGSIQTLQNPARLAQLPEIELVVADEAHRASTASWTSVLTSLGAYDPESPCVALGLSATLARGDGQGLGTVWQKVSFTYDILDGIAGGYLTDVICQRVTIDGMTLANVKMSGKDFQATSLSELMSARDTIDTVVAAYNEHAREMYGFVFTPDVDSAKRYAAAFQGAGYVAEAVWGDMPMDDRRLVMKRARAGDVQILVNCGIFTEGTDLPRFQCVVMARPTTSATLFVQAVGRALRPFPGKEKINGGAALVLDIAGVTQDHRLATMVDLSTRRINEVRPGESLKEAAQREIKARNGNLAGYVISSEEVDLFHQSRSVWLQTFGGVWFIPVGNAVVYVHPAKRDGYYHVGIKPLDGSAKTRPVKLNVPLEMAMAWGEQYAGSYGEDWQEREGKSFGMTRTANWRRRPASPGMITYAESLGIDVSGKPRAGDLSCIIEVNRASQVLDGKRNGST
jgi:superfamily II DNA or RNA helicase